jgi:hypothetical protein
MTTAPSTPASPAIKSESSKNDSTSRANSSSRLRA